MFLDQMQTDQDPANYELVARSLSRKNRKLRMKNHHLWCIVSDQWKIIKRLRKKNAAIEETKKRIP